MAAVLFLIILLVNTGRARVIGKESLRGIAEVQNAASKLNRIVVEQFIKVGENAVSFSPSSFMTTSNGDVKKVFWILWWAI